MTLDRVEAELPPLDCPDHAKGRLAKLCNWTAAGLLPGSVAAAAVRAVEVWLKANDSQLERERLREAEKRIADLEQELSRARRGRVRAG